ncbi:type VII secretion protein EccB [Embleya sp. NPDC050154]|uniref:type VII secretion protein EccB n=1 Tax=Embleya sp. NPDC050154 TaxID=3363988 RepID=UPI00379ACCA8
MATRREQLEAYIFARRRMVAAFLQPSPGGGTEENAPKPMRMLTPSIVVAMLVLVGFGVVGLVRPGTPPGWKDRGSLIVGRDSASRYVFLDGKLHPVLNIASGRLLLDPGRFKVNLVAEKRLDSVGHGAPLGIPNAPDRLPTAKAVKERKPWTVCERPALGKDGEPDPDGEPQRGVFIGAAPAEGALRPGEALFVQDRNRHKYLVHQGRRFLVEAPTVIGALNLVGMPAQPVGDAWLATLIEGGTIDHPTPAGYGAATRLPLAPEYNRVGVVLRAEGAARRQNYVVTHEGVMPVSELTAVLLTTNPRAREAYGSTTPTAFPVNLGMLGGAVVQDRTFAAEKGWPEIPPTPMNRITRDDLELPRNVVCNTFSGEWRGGRPVTAQSAGTRPPEQLADGMGGVWVKPGAGALYREVTGTPDDGGPTYLVADSGLRYAIAETARTGGAPAAREQESEAKLRLGYRGVEVRPLPRAWSELVARGPQLSTADAKRPQGS